MYERCRTSVPKRRLVVSANAQAHHPDVLADLPIALEPVALEHRHRRVVEERARDLPSGGVLRIALHDAPAHACDLVERSGKSSVRDPLVPVRAAHEEARDAPIGQFLLAYPVGLLVFDPRQLPCWPELTPPDTLLGVIDERGMRPAFAHPGFLERPALLRGIHVRGPLPRGSRGTSIPPTLRDGPPPDARSPPRTRHRAV